MALLTDLYEGIARFLTNENRIDKFVNQDGTYTTNESVPRNIPTYPSVVAAIEAQMEALLISANGISGVMTGCYHTATQGATTFDIAAGTLRFIDDYTTPGTPVVTSVVYAGATGIADSYTSSDVTYIGINSSGTVVQQTTPFTALQIRTICPIAVLGKSSGTILASASLVVTAYNSAWYSRDLQAVLGPIVSGGAYSGLAALQFARTAATMFRNGANYPTSYAVTNTVDLAAQSPVSFAVYSRNSSNTAWTNSGVLTTFDPTKYDNGGTSTAGIPTGSVTTNQWQAVRVYLSSNGYTLLQYGTAVYNSADAARTGAASESYYPAPVTSLAAFRGYLLVRGGASTFVGSANCIFVTAGKLGDQNLAGTSVPSPQSIVYAGYEWKVNASGNLVPGTASSQSVGSSTLPVSVVYDSKPMFAAYATADQTVSSATATKMILAGEEYDTAGAFDNATNYRFTPLVAGYYRFSARGRFATKTTVTSNISLQLYKNGSYVASLGHYVGVIFDTASNLNGPFGEVTIYMNGSTDYVELYSTCTISDSSSTSFIATSTTDRQNTTWFEGYLVRAGAA